MTSATSAPASTFSGGLPPFDSNEYRKSVLQPMLATNVVSIEDPFKLIGVDPSCDDTAALAERLDEVVGFWRKEQNSPRYKGLVSELVKRKGPLQGMLLDPEKRALARMRVQGTRRAQESARNARLDRLLKAVVSRHGGLPRSRVHLLEQLAKREGTSAELLAEKLAAVPIVEDGWGTAPLPDAVSRQVRSSLDALQMLGDRTRSLSLWAFLGMPATASPEDVQRRHAELVAENQASAHDRAKTVTGELLAQVKSVLFEPGSRGGYLVVLQEELRERLTDRVLELAIVDGELWPADVENLVRDAVALGTGLAPEQVRQAVRDTATGLGISMTTGKAADTAVCAKCQQADGVGAPVMPTAGIASPVGQAGQAGQAAHAAPVGGPAVHGAHGGPGAYAAPVPAQTAGPAGRPNPNAAAAADEWKSLDRELSQRRLMHALARCQRLVRLAPDVPGPGGQLPQQKLIELVRQTGEAKAALEAALAVESLQEREAALYAVLERVPDLEEAAAALAALPLAAPTGLVAALDGTTMRLRWTSPGGRTMTYSVTRVTRDARGARVEHALGVTTRCEAIDADLPRAGLVWHEIVAQLGARKSQPAATEPQPVVPDVSDLRAAKSPDGVTLTWNAPPGSDIVVERTVVGDDAAALKRLRARGTRWKDVEVEVGKSYRYVVRVEAAVGGVVARTPGCTVEVEIEPPPAAPMPTFAGAAPAGGSSGASAADGGAPAGSSGASGAAGGSGTSADASSGGAAFGAASSSSAGASAAGASGAPAFAGSSAAPAAPLASPPAEVPAVKLTVTPVPPGVVASWEAQPGAEVTILASQAPLGQAGDVVSLTELSARSRVVGFAVGSGTAFDADPGIAAIFTPVAVQNGRALLGSAVRHVAVGAVESLRAEPGADGRHQVRFALPRGCGEALLVWRRDRPPVDASDAEGGEVVTAERLATEGGWTVPSDDRPAFFHILVLPVVHLGGEPVFGPGTPVRVG